MFIYGATPERESELILAIRAIEKKYFVKHNEGGDKVFEGTAFYDAMMDFAVKEGFVIDEDYIIVSKKKAVVTLILVDGTVTVILNYIVKRRGIEYDVL